MTDFSVQRRIMVDSQVRPSDVTDRRIPRAMLQIPRELFVPASRRGVAYRDDTILLDESGPAARGQGLIRTGWLLAPRTFAKMAQALSIPDQNAQVLDIAGASGYSAAVLSRLARTVIALEDTPATAEMARSALASLDAANVTLKTGVLTAGHAAAAPYDAILVNGAVSTIPQSLLDQLKDGGRLIAILVEGGLSRATVWQRSGSIFDRRPLFDASAPRLQAFEPRPEFVF